MRFGKIITAGLAAALLLCSGAAQAGTDLNEVGAFLVYPVAAGFGAAGQPGVQPGLYETYIAIVHTGDADVNAHLVFINGQEKIADPFNPGMQIDNPEYCYECNYSLPLTPNDTELVVIRPVGAQGIQIDTEDRTLQGSCPHPFGMLTVNLEDPLGNVITDNTLLGSEVVVNYAAGWAYSMPAIPFQGKNGGDGDRNFEFDGQEYGAFPRVIAADFIAPDLQNAPISAELVLFTLGFQAEFPPATHCEIEGYDAAENPFSRSFNFGCWTMRPLWSPNPALLPLHSEFAYGNLGQVGCVPGPNGGIFPTCDTHGWFKLDCDVTAQGGDTVVGGVHGAIVQTAAAGAVVRRSFDPTAPAPALQQAAAWGRLLYQSVTTGGNVTYSVAGPGGSLGMN